MSELSEKPNGVLSGRWHLVGAECPDGQIPDHRVDLVFREDATGLRGAILSRVDDREIPLHRVAFSGAELRVQMGAHGQLPAEPPVLMMTAVADRFEGTWDLPGAEHIRLKLVRART